MLCVCVCVCGARDEMVIIVRNVHDELEKAVSISHNTSTHGKGMHLTILPPVIAIDLVSYPAHGLVNIYN